MYVDALLDRRREKIKVVERINGERRYREFPIDYSFYYADPKGVYTSIYGTALSKITCDSKKDFDREVQIHANTKLFESDVNFVFRCLEQKFAGAEVPTLNTCFFDIEVDWDKERGYSEPADPFNKITAISCYLDWADTLITLALHPNTLTLQEAEDMVKDFENTIVFSSEEKMLETFLDIIDDADVLSGWNSETYDIPYTINRIIRVLSKNDIRRFCLWGQEPKKRVFERYGAKQVSFDLIGRIHLDYMALYRKYTYHEMHSYSLDAIASHELGESKVVYEGTLDDLYNKDFKKFVDYNRQDAHLLYKLNVKLKFIDLSVQLAHENGVLVQTTMGVVAQTDQAIINEAHQRDLIVPNRPENAADSDSRAVGAYVANPIKGLHEWIGSIDINSLYPSVIRALNMAPETIIGQIRPIMTDAYISDKMSRNGGKFADAWEGLFGTLEYTAVMDKEIGTEVTIDWEDGETTTHSGAEVWKMLFDSNKPWTLSANGTIFTCEKEGVIPGLLSRWYIERQVLQKKMNDATTEEEKNFWDGRQHIKKINLNALYGALLNSGCRFFDKRLGQSTTLTGRSITRHMAAYVNEYLTEKYDHTGDAIIYGDTDSVYFSAWKLVQSMVQKNEITWSKEDCIALYDRISDDLNVDFPRFMEQAHHCPLVKGEIIRGGRELVAIKGLFITKKRYGLLMYDKDGERLDVNGKQGKVKAMGLDLKRSDTPKIVQDFLSVLLSSVLHGATRDEIVEKIIEFKTEFQEFPAWKKGTPKRVNNLTNYTAEEKRIGKLARLPGHVRAGMNWNNLKKIFDDRYSMSIIDGQKTIVCKLQQNPLNLTSVGYPIDETNLPQWFKDLPFDEVAMEQVIVDKKIDNLLRTLNWALEDDINIRSNINDLFDFG